MAANEARTGNGWPVARRRDWKAEYRRRQERARQRGFRSYYDERIRGGAEATPSTPAPTPEERRQRGGHAGYAAFIDYIHDGDTVMMADHISRIQRSPSGRYEVIEMLVIPDDPRRPTKRFWIRGLTRGGVRRMVEAEIEAGAVLTPVPSLDVRRLLTVAGRSDL